MHQFRFKVSEKIFDIKSLIRSSESDYTKINAIFEKMYAFNSGFRSFDFNSKNHAHRTNIVKIESDKMRLIEKNYVLLNMSYEILLSIYPVTQSENSLNLLTEIKRLKLFIDCPDANNYKQIMKFSRKIDLNFYEFVKILSNNYENYHKAFQFISTVKEFINLFKNLIESEKINYNFFSGFIKSFCLSDHEKNSEQLNICYKNLNKYYHEYLY